MRDFGWPLLRPPGRRQRRVFVLYRSEHANHQEVLQKDRRDTRYYVYSTELKGPDRITINSGLSYSWSKEDRGVHAAFDRTTGRAYYQAHFH
jgi:hypothetical protein